MLLNEHRQSSRRSKHERRRNGASMTDPPTFDHHTRAGRGSTQAGSPPSTYLSSPTPTTEETTAHRQRAQGQGSPRSGTTSSPRRPRKGTSTDPSPAPPAPTRGSRIRDEPTTKHAGAAPTKTPTPATHLPTLFTTRRHGSGVPLPLPRRSGRRRRGEPPAAPGKRGELDDLPRTRLSLL